MRNRNLCENSWARWLFMSISFGCSLSSCYFDISIPKLVSSNLFLLTHKGASAVLVLGHAAFLATGVDSEFAAAANQV